jgi:2-dehydropantoate 2-reductase
MNCLMRANIAEYLKANEGEAIALEFLEECRSVAAASGFDPRPDQIEPVRALLTDRNSSMTASMLRDIEANGPTEGEHVVGDMLRRGRARGLSLPLLRVALCHLQAYEARRVSRAKHAPIHDAGGHRLE